jgi:glycosyltransferase involved in cell wall biosynthesis
VLFIGAAADPSLWMHSADVYLSASEYEGLPLGVIEALGEGVPVLLSAIPGHSSLADSSRQFSLSDPAGGAAALEKLLAACAENDPDLAVQVSEWGKRVRAVYSLDIMVAEYARSYGR